MTVWVKQADGLMNNDLYTLCVEGNEHGFHVDER
jgi:hypothetical protein